jgi:hypothetical protein
LFPLVLTREQCLEYRLPRTPIKDSEKRKEGFEERHGAGATELDALEALHPGELARIVGDAMARYYDSGLDGRVSGAAGSVCERLGEIQDDVLSHYNEQITALQKEHKALRTAFEKKAASLRDRTRELWQEIEADLEAETPDIDTADIPEAAAAEELAGPLFDSGRDYMEQLAAYKQFQGK